MTFVDTNYFLRFLLADVKKHHQESKKLLQNGASGKTKLFTSAIVFFEIYWVLSSFYKNSKLKIVRILGDILKMTFIGLENRDLLQGAVGLFDRSNLDLEDAYNLVYAKSRKASSFATFDQKLTKRFTSLFR